MPEDTQHQQEQPQESASTTSTKSSWSSDALLGAFVWIAIIGVAAFVWLRSGRADVLLTVSGSDLLVASGAVASGGVPVTGGTVQILIEDPRGGRLLASSVANVTNTGTFTLTFDHGQLNGSRATGVRVTSSRSDAAWRSRCT